MIKQKFFAAFLLTLVPWVAFAEELPETAGACARIFATTQEAGATITKGQLNEFLRAVNAKCLSSAEGGEWANELLFSVLLSRPGEFIASFSEQEPSIQGNIIGELERPVHDGINIYTVIRATSNAGGNKPARQRILNSLKVAAQKTDPQLQ